MEENQRRDIFTIVLYTILIFYIMYLSFTKLHELIDWAARTGGHLFSFLRHFL
ncbi:hypothetical protein [Paenibacillus dokdonensis]|uniref:hypothetical protein n=1 Tax=Paenibacillus dokdonensis TaxID=2567944 RepID=UPI001457A262|nr:hypothetical protein [Paenibacillus dokdonensis]